MVTDLHYRLDYNTRRKILKGDSIMIEKIIDDEILDFFVIKST